MAQFSTRELLYLEDMSKMFESIEKNIRHARTEVTDQQILSMLNTMSQEHRQIIQSSGSLISSGRMQ